MTSRVELVHRVDQAHPERRLDLGCLARNEERVKSLERLHIASPGRGGHALRRQAHHDTIDVLASHVPRRSATCRQEPLQHTRPVIHTRLAEPAGDL